MAHKSFHAYQKFLLSCPRALYADSGTGRVLNDTLKRIRGSPAVAHRAHQAVDFTMKNPAYARRCPNGRVCATNVRSSPVLFRLMSGEREKTGGLHPVFRKSDSNSYLWVSMREIIRERQVKIYVISLRR